MTFREIFHGDAAAELRDFVPACIDLIVTDPPYLCNYRDRDRRRVANDTNPNGVLPVFPELFRVLKPDSYLLFCGWNAIDAFSTAWGRAGFRTAGHIIFAKPYTSSVRHVAYAHESAWVLTKGTPTPPSKPLRDVQDWVYSGNKRHPTEKAVDILVPLITAFSRPGDVVLDPFLGSGSTAVAARIAGRSAVGIELEERYYQSSQRRLANVVCTRSDPTAEAA